MFSSLSLFSLDASILSHKIISFIHEHKISLPGTPTGLPLSGLGDSSLSNHYELNSSLPNIFVILNVTLEQLSVLNLGLISSLRKFYV